MIKMSSIKHKYLVGKNIIYDAYYRKIMETKMTDQLISHIAMFHDIIQNDEYTDDDYACTISNLVKYIEYCKNIGLKPVSVDELLGKDKISAVKGHFVVSFDDGFESMSTIMAPILTEMDIPFIIFITTSFLDRPGYLTSSELKELNDNPLCTIGMHSHEHIYWIDKRKEELIADFNKCSEIINTLIGHQPEYYAFPYGSHMAVSNSNVRIIARQNVKGIFLTNQRKLLIRDLKNPLKGLPRLDIPGYFNGRRTYKNS